METKGDNSDNSDQMDTDQSNDSESEDTLKCLICNQKYITNLDLKEHIKTVHTSEKEKTILKARYILKSKDFRSVEYDDPLEYNCENCSEVVRGQINLKAHNFQYHHVNPEFEKKYPPKGQLISKCPFGVIVSTKKTNEISLRISALASKKRLDQINKGTLYH